MDVRPRVKFSQLFCRFSDTFKYNWELGGANIDSWPGMIKKKIEEDNLEKKMLFLFLSLIK